MRCERGQAAIEWVGLVLIATLGLGALLTAVPVADGRSLGGMLSTRIVCAVRGDCSAADAALASAYGEDDAALMRQYAPDIVYEPGERSIPVDFRACRRVACAVAPDDRDLDVHRSGSGQPATVFTRLLRRDGSTYLQYWFYYPDSNSTVLGADRAWALANRGLPLGDYPGFHRDDWEAYVVRLDAAGQAQVRATSHGHYQWCKQSSCRDAWGPRTGWTRVSRGSHAGHIPLERTPTLGGQPSAPRYSYEPSLPGANLRERTTTATGLALVPLESVDRSTYRRLDDGIKPPWEKAVYSDPESDES